MRQFKFLFLSCIIFISYHSKASTYVFDNPDEVVPIAESVMILEDPADSLSIFEIIRSDNFKKNSLKVPNLDVTPSAWWIKITIKNVTEYQHLLLKVDFPIIDEVEFYSFTKEGFNVQKLGEYQVFSKRKYKDPNYIFDLTIPKNQTQTYYLKIKSGEQIMLPIVVGRPQQILEQIAFKDWVFGIYFGIILVMFLYNLFLFFTVKDKSYLFYVIYILCVGLTQTFLHGYTFKFLWPNSPWLAIHSMYLLPSFVGIAIAEFIKVFLHVKSHSIYYNRILNVINAIYILCIVLAVLGFHNLSQKIIHINAMAVSISALFIAYKIARKGYRPAKFFLFAWFIFLIGVCVFILKDFGILPYNDFTVYTMPAGTAIEVVLISFALADRINILKKEKEQSQQEALEALQEKQKLIKEQNITLDYKVKERTLELEAALTDLKATQSQLVNAEKMASLGQLTAGVAHEINNPINFVSSSIKPLKRDISDLWNVLSMYDEINESNFKDKMNEIKQTKSDLDIDYVKEEIDSLLKGIDEGAFRTSEIVKGLKTFSRLDETDLKRVDLNEGIDSTLVLLNSLLGGNIEVVKEYGDIPKIECFAGKLNQVFMNILNNAIHAVMKQHPDSGGKIIIQTIEKGEVVEIRIKDNGTGIPDKVRNKIFDPFFTTKDVGEGTGLGLSIVYNIIESHKGKISVESEMGEGAEFIITLPKLQNN